MGLLKFIGRSIKQILKDSFFTSNDVQKKFLSDYSNKTDIELQNEANDIIIEDVQTEYFKTFEYKHLMKTLENSVFIEKRGSETDKISEQKYLWKGNKTDFGMFCRTVKENMDHSKIFRYNYAFFCKTFYIKEKNKERKLNQHEKGIIRDGAKNYKKFVKGGDFQYRNMTLEAILIKHLGEKCFDWWGD
ncbi:MAG: hypothetical protein IJ213_02060 [Bacteroidales bacterium]|nr:hypothetical protein [Bacteroidales bacterium]